VGAIIAYGGRPDTGHYPPAGWLACDGHAVYRSEYPELFAVIADQYGPGDGSTTFNLPDCRSRFLIGAGQGLGLSNYIVSEYGGNETHTLTITEMPPHTHTGVVSPNNPVSNRAVVSSGGIQTVRTAGTSDSTGGGAAFDIMNPWLAIAYYIYAGNTPSEPEIDVTVIVVFPSHTPTPTNTPTLTPTAGPSPTPTATATQTPISEIGYPVGDQTVRILNQVTPGDLVIVGFLAVVISLLLTILFFLIRRRS
jgi:microcystin-dependent protein